MSLVGGLLRARGGYVLLMALSVPGVGCGGGDGGGGGGVDAGPADADISSEPMLVDQIGCHMLGDYEQPVAVAGYDDTPIVCIQVTGPSLCLVANERFNSCVSAGNLFFEWEAGSWYNVKGFDWTVMSSSHGEVTTETNADSGILGVPPSTTVTASATNDYLDDGRTFEIVFRMEDDYVVFEKIDPPGGW